MQIADLFASLSLKTDQGSFATGNKLISGVKGALGGIAAFFAIEKLTEGVKSVIDLGSAINDTSQKTGISAQALQFYGFVAKQNSSSMDELAGASTKLSKGLGEVANTGKGPAADGLAALHLSMKQVQDASPDDRLTMIANAFVKLGPEANKQAIAMDLFGKSGAALIPTLNDLGENGDALRKQFDELGVAIDDKSIKALDELGDNVDKAKAQFGGLKNQVVVAILPTLTKMVTGLMSWVKANKAIIASSLGKVVDGLVAGFQVLGDVIDAVTTLFKDAWAGDDGAQAILIGIAAVVASVVIPALWAMTVPIILATLPLLAIVGVVALLALGVIKIIKHWDQVKSVMRSVAGWFVGIGHGIVSAFDSAWEFVKSSAKAAFEWIISLPVVKQLIELYNYFKNAKGTDSANAAADKAKAGGADAIGQYGAFYKNLTGVDSPADNVAPSGAKAAGDITATTTINVTSNSADPKAVGEATKQAFIDHWQNILRDAHAATGGADQ